MFLFQGIETPFLFFRSELLQHCVFEYPGVGDWNISCLKLICSCFFSYQDSPELGNWNSPSPCPVLLSPVWSEDLESWNEKIFVSSIFALISWDWNSSSSSSWSSSSSFGVPCVSRRSLNINDYPEVRGLKHQCAIFKDFVCMWGGTPCSRGWLMKWVPMDPCEEGNLLWTCFFVLQRPSKFFVYYPASAHRLNSYETLTS